MLPMGLKRAFAVPGSPVRRGDDEPPTSGSMVGLANFCPRHGSIRVRLRQARDTQTTTRPCCRDGPRREGQVFGLSGYNRAGKLTPTFRCQGECAAAWWLCFGPGMPGAGAGFCRAPLPSTTMRIGREILG